MSSQSRPFREAFKQFWKELHQEPLKKGANIATILLAFVAVTGLLLSSCHTISQINLSREQMELTRKHLAIQLRPFLGVLEDPNEPRFSFRKDAEHERYWLTITYIVQNFGEQPAFQYVRKNDKVIIVNLPTAVLEELTTVRNNPSSTVTAEDEARQEIIDVRNSVLDDLYRYLRANPMASFTEVNEQFASSNVLSYGDILEHFPPPTVVLPEQFEAEASRRDVGLDYGLGIAQGKKVLVYYSHFTYEGAVPGSTSSTFYIGYYDENASKVYKGKDEPIMGGRLREYRQWTSRENL